MSNIFEPKIISFENMVYIPYIYLASLKTITNNKNSSKNAYNFRKIASNRSAE